MTGADDESSSVPRGGRFLEAAAVGVLGGALGAAATSPLGLAVPVGVIAAADLPSANPDVTRWNITATRSC